FFSTRTPTTAIYTLSLHDALPILYPAPEHNPTRGLRLRWCRTRLGRNASLAGIKHLNRLEQVLAQAEWNDAATAEGLMLDTEGRSEEHTSELQSRENLVCRLLLEK